jgi:hypothetical protein
MPHTAKIPSVDGLLAFWRGSPALVRFFDEFCTGPTPAGGVFSGTRIVLADGDRENFYVISVEDGAYCLRHTHDGLLVSDPEADLEVLDRDEDLDTVFAGAMRELGFDPATKPSI